MTTLGAVGEKIKNIAAGTKNVIRDTAKDAGTKIVQDQFGKAGYHAAKHTGLDRTYKRVSTEREPKANVSSSEGDGAYGGQAAPIITGKAGSTSRMDQEVAGAIRTMGNRVTGAVEDISAELKKLRHRAGGDATTAAESARIRARKAADGKPGSIPRIPRIKGRGRFGERRAKARARAEERAKKVAERRARREAKRAGRPVEERKPSIRKRVGRVIKGTARGVGRGIAEAARPVTTPLRLAGKGLAHALPIIDGVMMANDIHDGFARAPEEYGQDNWYTQREAGANEAIAGIVNTPSNLWNLGTGAINSMFKTNIPQAPTLDPRDIAKADKAITNKIFGSWSPFAEKSNTFTSKTSNVVAAKKIIFEAGRSITFKARTYRGLPFGGVGAGGGYGGSGGGSGIGGQGGSSGSGVSGMRRMPPNIRYGRQHEGRSVPGYSSKGYGHNTPAESKYDLKNPVNKNTDLKKGAQTDLIGGVYDAYRRAGFSHEGAKTMAAEVGRENSYNPNLIFGHHSDPYNGATNVGMLSWQNERGRNVYDQLKQKGFINPDGSIMRTQGALDTMAAFSAQEMDNMTPDLAKKMRDPTKSYADLQYQTGKSFVKWRIDDPRYHDSGMRNQNKFYDAVSGMTDKSDVGPVAKDQTPASKDGSAPTTGTKVTGGSSAYGGAHPDLVNSPGRSPNTKDVDPRLVEILAAAQTHLPPGYHVTVNEGFNKSGHVGNSQHHIQGAGALDVKIWDPNGKGIDNEGGDPTGMYHILARGAYGEMKVRYPELDHHLTWGGAFGASRTNAAQDLMHFDLGVGFKGERGGYTENILSKMGPLPDFYQKSPEVAKTEPNVTAKPLQIDRTLRGAGMPVGGQGPSIPEIMKKTAESTPDVVPTPATEPPSDKPKGSLFSGDPTKYKMGPGGDTGRLQPGTPVGMYNDKGEFSPKSKAVFLNYLRDENNKVIGMRVRPDGGTDEDEENYKFTEDGHKSMGAYMHAVKDENDKYIGGDDNPMTGHVKSAAADNLGDSPGDRIVKRANSLDGSNDKRTEKELGRKMTAGEWCADFVNGVLGKEGIKGTKDSLSEPFKKWGMHVDVKKDGVKPGDIIVEYGKTDTGQKLGHVGISNGKVKYDGNNNPVAYGMVSGNHDDAVVKDYWEDASRVTELRRATAKEIGPAPQPETKKVAKNLPDREKKEEAGKPKPKKDPKDDDKKDRKKDFDKHQNTSTSGKEASAGRVRFDSHQAVSNHEFA